MGGTSSSTALKFDIGHATHTGQLRFQNEDSFCALQLNASGANQPHKPILVAVADGMGGEEAGEVASSLAIHKLVDQVKDLLSARKKPDTGWLKQTVEQLNTVVTAEAKRRGHVMGTTLVSALIYDSKAYLANVGDSRIYRWRRGTEELERLVKDHSLVQLLVDEGIIADNDRYAHPRRNYITRSLGDADTGVTDDNPTLPLRSGDWLMLCSDGLWEMVRDDAILDVLSGSTTAQTACDTLVSMANVNGGEDNITVIIVRVH